MDTNELHSPADPRHAPRWQRLRDGTHPVRSPFEVTPTDAARHRLAVAVALQITGSDAVASHWSAALLHGLPAPNAPTLEVTLTVPPGTRRGTPPTPTPTPDDPVHPTGSPRDTPPPPTHEDRPTAATGTPRGAAPTRADGLTVPTDSPRDAPHAPTHADGRTVPTGSAREASATRTHEAPLATRHLGSVDGLPATSVARTVVDLARTVSTVDAIVAADAALHLRLLRRGDLLEIGRAHV